MSRESRLPQHQQKARPRFTSSQTPTTSFVAIREGFSGVTQRRAGAGSVSGIGKGGGETG